MKKKILIGSIIAVVLLTLVSFSSVVGYQITRTTSQNKMERFINKINEKMTHQSKINVDNYPLVTSSLFSVLKKHITQPLIFLILDLYLQIALLIFPLFLAQQIVNQWAFPLLSSFFLSIFWLPVIVSVVLFLIASYLYDWGPT